MTTMYSDLAPTSMPRLAAVPTRRRIRLVDIDPHSPAAVRSTGRVGDIPGRRPVKPITFDSAL